MVTVTDPDLLWGAERGRQMLDANTATQKLMSGRYLDRYGMNQPDIRGHVNSRLDAARGTAGEDMDLRMKLGQLRKDLHSQRLKLMWDAFRRQQKDASSAQRQHFYGAILGAGAQLGASAWPALFPAGGGAPAGGMSGGDSAWMADVG